MKTNGVWKKSPFSSVFKFTKLVTPTSHFTALSPIQASQFTNSSWRNSDKSQTFSECLAVDRIKCIFEINISSNNFYLHHTSCFHSLLSRFLCSFFLSFTTFYFTSRELSTSFSEYPTKSCVISLESPLRLKPLGVYFNSSLVELKVLEFL